MKTLTTHQFVLLTVILALIGAALWISYFDYQAAGIHHPEVYVLMLAISYLLHMLFKLSMHGYQNINRHIWFTRLLIIGFSLIPIVFHSEPIHELKASLIDFKQVLPFILLGAIEGLLAECTYAYVKKKPNRKRGSKG